MNNKYCETCKQIIPSKESKTAISPITKLKGYARVREWKLKNPEKVKEQKRKWYKIKAAKCTRSLYP